MTTALQAPAPNSLDEPRTCASAPDAADAASRTARLAARALDATLSFVLPADAAEAESLAEHARGSGADLCALSRPGVARLCRRLLSRGLTIEVDDVREAPGPVVPPGLQTPPGMALAGTPIVGEGDVLLGGLFVLDHRPRAWSAQDRQALADLAVLAAQELSATLPAPAAAAQVGDGVSSDDAPALSRAQLPELAPEPTGGDAGPGVVELDAGPVAAPAPPETVDAVDAVEAFATVDGAPSEAETGAIPVPAAPTGTADADEGSVGVLDVAPDVALDAPGSEAPAAPAAAADPFRAVLEDSPDLVAVFEPGGRVLLANRTLREAAGLDGEDDDGEPSLAELLPRDLAARILEEAERRAEARWEAAAGRLAEGVACHLDDLVASIRGFAGLLQGDLPEHDPRREFADEIRQRAGRAASLTRRLLAAAGRQPCRPRPLDLAAHVADLQAVVGRLVGEDVALEIATGARGATVLADPLQVEHVLLDLAANARDAMPEGGTLRVSVSRRGADGSPAGAGRPGAHVVVSVSDTGCGMEPGTRERAFEPFFTTHAGRAGLGLSAVRGIVRQSGGFVEVESEPGQGATFRVHLPAVDAAPRARTVLVVEARARVRAELREALEDAGYRVLEAGSASAALAVLDAGDAPVDLILAGESADPVGPTLVERAADRRPGAFTLHLHGDPGAAVPDAPLTPDALLRRIQELLETLPD